MPGFRRHYLNSWSASPPPVSVDDTAIEELDFDVPCESPDVHDPVPAADWILWRVQCCPKAPAALTVCEACRRLMLQQPVAWCMDCGWRFTPLFAAIIRAEPIKHVRPPGPA